MRFEVTLEKNGTALTVSDFLLIAYKAAEAEA
jgi:hypothetical protein